MGDFALTISFVRRRFAPRPNGWYAKEPCRAACPQARDFDRGPISRRHVTAIVASEDPQSATSKRGCAKHCGRREQTSIYERQVQCTPLQLIAIEKEKIDYRAGTQSGRIKAAASRKLTQGLP